VPEGNEAKFLGPKFMAIRWALTVLAIIIFSWISAKIIRDEDLPGEMLAKPGLHINKDACMGCTLCAKNYPTLFIMQGKKAVVKAYDKQALDYEKLQSVIKACPVHAIEYSEQ
jgi:ferredoxin